jgi:hypothetical protein
LKGRLTEAGIKFPKTHDLVDVLALTTPLEPLWGAFSGAFAKITDWAVLPRYPGNSATSIEAKEALKICRRFRAAARSSLGL